MSFVGNVMEGVISGGVGYMVGGVYHAHRRKQKTPEVFLSVCPQCGENFEKWEPMVYSEDASRFEQRRTCSGCGLVQRRKVSR